MKAEAGEDRPGGGRRVPEDASGRTVEAVVVEERPSGIYRVRWEERHEVLAHPVGNVKRNFVRLVPGDRVEVVLMPYDPTRGRITRKLA